MIELQRNLRTGKTRKIRRPAEPEAETKAEEERKTKAKAEEERKTKKVQSHVEKDDKRQRLMRSTQPG